MIVSTFDMVLFLDQEIRGKQKYREKKNAANKAVVKARDEKQKEWSKRI